MPSDRDGVTGRAPDARMWTGAKIRCPDWLDIEAGITIPWVRAVSRRRAAGLPGLGPTTSAIDSAAVRGHSAASGTSRCTTSSDAPSV